MHIHIRTQTQETSHKLTIHICICMPSHKQWCRLSSIADGARRCLCIDCKVVYYWLYYAQIFFRISYEFGIRFNFKCYQVSDQNVYYERLLLICGIRLHLNRLAYCITFIPKSAMSNQHTQRVWIFCFWYGGFRKANKRSCQLDRSSTLKHARVVNLCCMFSWFCRIEWPGHVYSAHWNGRLELD